MGTTWEQRIEKIGDNLVRRKTVPIFARRILQKLLDENAAFLDERQLLNHVNKLNNFDDATIDFEWEVVMLNAFSKIGAIQHEPPLGGTSFIDVYYKAFNASSIEFIADIATVSDRGLEQQNRQELFQKDLARVLKKHQLSPKCFSWEIKGGIEGEYRNGKMKLKLAEGGKWKEIFDKEFIAFINKIKGSPNLFLRYEKNTESIGYVVTYNPEQKGQFGHYPAYKVAYSLTKNPVRNALNRKSDQLKASGYNGIKAIVLCDGGCALLNDTDKGHGSFTIDEVINSFFNNSSSVDFVLTFAIEEVCAIPMFRQERQFRIVPRFYPNMSLHKNGLANIFSAVESLPSFFPQPKTTAQNAQYCIKSGNKKGMSFKGGLTMSNKQIKISSRALLELLAGEVPIETFFNDHGQFSVIDKDSNHNLFKLKSREGCLFTQIRIEKCETEDDDWVVFEFGDPDPATSLFHISQK